MRVCALEGPLIIGHEGHSADIDSLAWRLRFARRDRLLGSPLQPVSISSDQEAFPSNVQGTATGLLRGPEELLADSRLVEDSVYVAEFQRIFGTLFLGRIPAGSEGKGREVC